VCTSSPNLLLSKAPQCGSAQLRKVVGYTEPG
jgi:hypothetical protein